MEQQSCIYCLDNNELLENSHCKCRYFYHKKCEDKFIMPNSHIICPLCRISINLQPDILHQQGQGQELGQGQGQEQHEYSCGYGCCRCLLHFLCCINIVLLFIIYMLYNASI